MPRGGSEYLTAAYAQGVIDRFWAKVDRRGPDECWPWLGSTRGGYGNLRAYGRKVQAHRLSWEIENQQTMPPELDGLHSCDNPPCVNPAHIWPGTALENVLDAIAKGRAPQLEKNTLCQRGHPIEEMWGTRMCRTCQRVANTASKRRVRARAKA